MIIANVMLSRGLGGIEQSVVDYSEALRLAGHDVFAIVDTNASIIDSLKKSDIPYFTLSNLGAWDVFAGLRLYLLLNKLKASICIAHGNRALSLLRFASGSRKLITVTHNYKINLDGIKTIFCPTLHLVADSQNQGIPKENIHHIPNMVRLRQGVTEPTRRDPIVIGTLGRFVAKKGFDLFIESLAILKSRNIVFKAVIAGSGEEEKNLKALVTSKGLQDCVTFPGWISNKEDFFDMIDIFCLPSHHEPFGIALLEAMAHKLPVISTASEGPSEIIHNGIDGMLVEKNNPAALADGIAQIINDPIQTKLLGINAYDSVRDNYDLPVVSRKLALAIKSL